jgi:hypothetical protein
MKNTELISGELKFLMKTAVLSMLLKQKNSKYSIKIDY